MGCRIMSIEKLNMVSKCSRKLLKQGYFVIQEKVVLLVVIK